MINRQLGAAPIAFNKETRNDGMWVIQLRHKSLVRTIYDCSLQSHTLRAADSLKMLYPERQTPGIVPVTMSVSKSGTISNSPSLGRTPAHGTMPVAH